MSVCCIGQSAYDITVRIDEQLVPDRKYRAESHVECSGGPALNAACVCSKWDEPTSLVSRVGDDQYGSMKLYFDKLQDLMQSSKDMLRGK